MLEDLAAEMKQEQDRTEKISSSAVQSYGVNPDQHAGDIKLARKAGLPPALMPDMNEDARLRVLLDQIDLAPPAVTRFVSDPENLKVSHDDLDNMSALERTFDVLKKAGRSLASVPWRASSQIAGGLQAMGEIDDAISKPLGNLWETISGVPSREGALTRYAKSIRSGAKSTAEDIKGDTTGAGIMERGLYSGIESLGQNLLTLPLTIMTGSATPMLTSMTAMSGGEGYGTARDKGKGIAQSLIYGGNQAGIEYLTEVAPALLLVKNLKAKTGLMKFGRDMLASEVPNEQYATALQDLNEWAVLNPEKPFADYVAERPTAAVETLIATIVGTGGMVVTSKGLEKIGASVDKFQTATDNKNFLLALGDGVQASKLRERMPEKMQELIKSMKEEHGTPEHAYVDANILTELWQSQGFDPQVKAAEMFSDPSGYAEALATGSEVAIPLEEFAQKFTGEGYYKALIEDVRLGSGSSTMKEAEEWDKTGRDEAIKELIEEADGIAPTPSDMKIYDDVVGQLIGTGMERQTAERNALVMKSVFRTLGARTGQDALDLYKEYGLKIARPLPESLSKRLAVDLSLDPLLDRLREGNIPKDKDVRGKSLSEYLRKQGVKDDGGELAALDPDSGIKGKAKKLIKADGFELDRARLVAIEDGYLPEGATIRDFLDAISNDLAGRGVYSNNNLNTQLADEQMSLAQMKEFLDARDIDVQDMTNEEIKAVLQETNQGGSTQEMNQFDKGSIADRIVAAEGGVIYVSPVSDNQGTSDSAVNQSSGGMVGDVDVAGVQEQFALFLPEGSAANPEITPKKESGVRKVQVGTMYSAIKKVRTPSEAAHVAFPLASRAQEALIAIVTDKKGNILGVIQHTTGSLNQSIVHPRDLLGVVHDFDGAAEVWLAHNHPSGDPTFSNEDRNITDRIAGVLDGSAIKLRGMLAVGLEGGGMYYEGPGAGSTTIPLKDITSKGERKKKLETYDREIIGLPDGPRISSSIGLSDYVKTLGSDASGIIVVNGKNIPSQFVPMTLAEMKKLKTGEASSGSSAIMQAFHKGNGAAMFMFAPGLQNDYAAVKNIASFGEVLGGRLLDGLDTDNGYSVASSGNMPSGGSTFFQAAYHGSPHTFDKFKMSAMGTGEGAQAFGHGLYFTDSEEIAKFYRDKLGAANSTLEIDGKPYDGDKHYELSDVDQIIARGFHSLPKNYRTKDELVKELKSQLKGVFKEWKGRYKEAIAKAQSDAVVFNKPGKMYKVEIAPANDELLDWNKPFTEQSKKVKEILKSSGIMKDYNDNLSDFTSPSEIRNPSKKRGDSIYEFLTWRFEKEAKGEGAARASKLLHSLGIRGIKYAADSIFKQTNKKASNFVVFDDSDITITEMYQKQADTKRAFIRFGEDRQFNIGFLENADLSSFLHESSHFYFEVMADLAGKENAPQQIVDDYNTLLKYVGAGNREAITVEQHEVIARSFEAYLMEGKAPSVELQGAFSRMKAWLVQVYKEIRKLNVKLNDDVRGVFDRLVASDEEIEAARTRQGLKEVFATAEDMGVSEAEFQIYRKQGEKVHASQIEKLEKEYLAEMTRLNQQWWNDGLEKMAAEVSGETEDYPVYIAIQVLTKGVTFAGEVADLKLDRKTLEKQYGKTLVKRLPRGIFGKEGGLSADQVAEMTGFESGSELIEAMITAPSRKEFIKAEADRRMRALHGDLLTDGSAADEATLAVHTDEQAKVLHEELRAMRKLQTTVEKVSRAKEGENRAARNEFLGAIPPAEFFKDLARDMVAKKMIEELLPHRYQQAEAKAAREAFEAAAKKDWSKAAEAKQRQILNHYLYKEAANIKKMVDKQVGKWNDLIKKSDKRLAASRDMNIVTAARAVLAAYGIGDSPDKALAALNLVQQYDANLYESLQMAVDVATQEPKPWKKLQLTEFIGLMDAVNNLWHLSRRSKVAMIDGLAVGLDEINDDLHLQIGGRARPFSGMGKTSAVTDLQKLKIGFLGMGAALKRVEHWTVEMDRGDSGPFHNFILRPIYNAVTQYKAEKKPVIGKLREIFSRLDSDVFSDKKISAPELGYTFKNKGELLHAILHTGNESNLKKLLVGRNWADAENEQRALDRSRWDAFLDRMHQEQVLTEADYVFAQDVWDLLESTKAGAQKAHHDMYGYYFAEITAEPVVTPFGTFRGGYVPAITDPYLVESAAERADQENLLQDNASSMFPATTGKGFTMSRVAGYNKPLLLDLGLMANHVDKVLRFSTMGPAIQDVGRILNNSELKETFAEINPAWSSEMLIPWLKRTARQTVETKSSGWGGKAADAVFRGLRRRAGLQLMAANIGNAAQQLTGLFPAMAKVSPRKVGTALFQFTRNPFELTREITGKSPWMADRLDNEISQISGELRDILTQSKYEKAQDFGMRAGYWASGAAQHIVDVITWQAAYDEKISQGEDETESVQYADSVVRQTQGSFAPEDASSFEAKSPFVRLFTQFYSYFNMISNLAITESRNTVSELGWKGGTPKLFYIYMLTFALPSFLSQLIMAAMRGKIDEDEDGEYIDDVMMMFFTGQARAVTALIPGVGQVINAAIGKFTKLPYDDRMSVSPAVSALEGSVGAGKDLYDVLLDGKELKRAHVRDVFTLAGMVTGLPFAAAARPLGYMVAAESGATEPANNIDYIRGLMTGYAPK